MSDDEYKKSIGRKVFIQGQLAHEDTNRMGVIVEIPPGVKEALVDTYLVKVTDDKGDAIHWIKKALLKFID